MKKRNIDSQPIRGPLRERRDWVGLASLRLGVWIDSMKSTLPKTVLNEFSLIFRQNSEQATKCFTYTIEIRTSTIILVVFIERFWRYKTQFYLVIGPQNTVNGKNETYSHLVVKYRRSLTVPSCLPRVGSSHSTPTQSPRTPSTWPEIKFRSKHENNNNNKRHKKNRTHRDTGRLPCRCRPERARRLPCPSRSRSAT